jgi:hypothetical protein
MSKGDATQECDDLHMRGLLIALLLLAAPPAPAQAQGPRQIRVEVRFSQTAERSRQTVLGTERRVQRSTGIFTLVQDGGESLLTVATQVPVHQVAFYRDYATGAGHVTSGVAFREVGTTLKVQAALLAGNRIRVRLTPRISYVSTDGSGAIELTEAVTDLVVPGGRPVALGGSASETHTVLRHVLGIGREREASQIVVVLIATAR